MTQGTGSGEPRMTETPAQTRAAAPRRQAADTGSARDQRHGTEREAQEREVTEDREITEAERLEFFRESLQQSVLPDLPRLDGYHVCWLSTTHQRDTIAYRMRLGYTLIRVSELPGWGGGSIKEGDLQGVVSVNEMVAAKIPMRLYNLMMQHVHHTLPLEEEGKLTARIDLLKQAAHSRGTAVDEGDGTANVVQRARPMPELTE